MVSMKDDTKKLIEEFSDRSDEIAEGLFEDFNDIFGMVPFIFTVLQEREKPFLFNSLGDYYTSRPESLDPKTAEIATIAAAAACGADKCLGVHIGAALRAGVTRDQILDTILIGAMIDRTKSLAVSLKVFDKCAGKAEE